eukprot:1122168-Alexandrium_andersonii.AAC.1
MDTHRCAAVRVDASAREVRFALRAFPVEVVASSDNPRHASVRGLPAPVVGAVVRHLGAAAWVDAEESLPCTCSVKSALVPSHSVLRWQDALGAL